MADIIPAQLASLHGLTLEQIAESCHGITDEVLARIIAVVSGVPVAAFQSAI
jgi:hypothetical protein